jgi:hypothetical protein
MSRPLTDAEKVASYERSLITGFQPIITKKAYNYLKMSMQALSQQRNNKRNERDDTDDIDHIDRVHYSSKTGRPSTPPTRSRTRARTRANRLR